MCRVQREKAAQLLAFGTQASIGRRAFPEGGELWEGSGEGLPGKMGSGKNGGGSDEVSGQGATWESGGCVLGERKPPQEATAETSLACSRNGICTKLTGFQVILCQ